MYLEHFWLYKIFVLTPLVVIVASYLSFRLFVCGERFAAGSLLFWNSGMILNLIVIYANGGKMPVAAGSGHFPYPYGYIPITPHTRFVFLCDRIHGPLGSMASVGDLVIFTASMVLFLSVRVLFSLRRFQA